MIKFSYLNKKIINVPKFLLFSSDERQKIQLFSIKIVALVCGKLKIDAYRFCRAMIKICKVAKNPTGDLQWWLPLSNCQMSLAPCTRYRSEQSTQNLEKFLLPEFFNNNKIRDLQTFMQIRPAIWFLLSCQQYSKFKYFSSQSRLGVFRDCSQSSQEQLIFKCQFCLHRVSVNLKRLSSFGCDK